MGRKPKAQGSTSDKPQTAENISEDQLQALFFQSKRDYERALGTKKKADADFKNCCKRIKAELGKRGVAEIKLAIMLGSDEGEADAKGDIESKLRVMRWMGLALGSQADLFPDIDPTPIVDRAFAEGRRHALAGEPRANPHHHTTEAARAYNAGYENGQEEKIRTGIKPIEPEVAGDIKKDVSIGSSRPTFEVH